MVSNTIYIYIIGGIVCFFCFFCICWYLAQNFSTIGTCPAKVSVEAEEAGNFVPETPDPQEDLQLGPYALDLLP
jgi:Na+/proline symporter